MNREGHAEKTRIDTASRRRRVQSAPRPRWLQWTVVCSAIAFSSLGGGMLYASRLEDRGGAFCASCHTEPETAYFKRMLETTPTDLASAHAVKNVTCIQCHSGPGVTGRIGAMMVGAGDLTAYLSGHYHNPAVVTVAVGDAYCLKCHASVVAKQDFQNHFHVFLGRWQKADRAAATCVDCHQSHVIGGQPKDGFLQQTPTTKVCQRCHTFAGAGGG